MAEERTAAYEQLLRQGGDRMLREASAYFAGAGRLYGALRRLTQRLDAEGIPYALWGGLALAEHGYPRLTEDIDLLLTPSGLERFRQQLVGRGYRPAFNGASGLSTGFRDTETGVRIEIVTTGEYPGDGLPKPVPYSGSRWTTVHRSRRGLSSAWSLQKCSFTLISTFAMGDSPKTAGAALCGLCEKHHKASPAREPGLPTAISLPIVQTRCSHWFRPL